VGSNPTSDILFLFFASLHRRLKSKNPTKFLILILLPSAQNRVTHERLLSHTATLNRVTPPWKCLRRSSSWTRRSSRRSHSNGSQPNPEELVAKAIALVKKEFLRPPPPILSSTSTGLQNNTVSQTKVVSAKEKKSKRQLKRERHQVLSLSLSLALCICVCFKFLN
jgi:hypothetical protein